MLSVLTFSISATDQVEELPLVAGSQSDLIPEVLGVVIELVLTQPLIPSYYLVLST